MNYNGTEIFGNEHADLAEFAPYQNWLEKAVKNGYEIKAVTILKLARTPHNKVLFAFISVEALAPTTNEFLKEPVNSFVLLRGDSATIYWRIFTEKSRYALLVEQKRISVGKLAEFETIAGMNDKEDGVRGRIVAEAMEEAGLELNGDRVTFLGKYSASCGLLDEHIHCFYTEIHITEAELAEMHGRINGLAEEGEVTITRIMNEADLKGEILNGNITDGKIIACLSFMTLRGLNYTRS